MCLVDDKDVVCYSLCSLIIQVQTISVYFIQSTIDNVKNNLELKITYIFT